MSEHLFDLRRLWAEPEPTATVLRFPTCGDPPRDMTQGNADLWSRRATIVPLASTPGRKSGASDMDIQEFRTTVFRMMDRGVTAAVGRGTKKCRKLMHAMDSAYEAEPRLGVVSDVGPMDSEARLLLRARCGICPKRCKTPLT